MIVCLKKVSFLSMLFLFSITNFAQQSLPNPGNGDETQYQPPQRISRIIQPEQIVTVRNTIVHTLLRNPDWPNQPAWKAEDWNPWTVDPPAGITNRFGKFIGAYGVLIHKVPLLHLRLPIDLNYDGIIDYHIDSKHRRGYVGDKSWKVGSSWRDFDIVESSLNARNDNDFRVISQPSPDPDKAWRAEPWALPLYSGGNIGCPLPFETPSSFGKFGHLMKSVREGNGCAIDQYGGTICTLAIPYYRVSTPLLESVPSYIGLRFKIASKTHYGWIKMEQFSPGKYRFPGAHDVRIPSDVPGDIFVSEYAYELRPDTPIQAGSGDPPPPPITSIAPTKRGTFILDWMAKIGRVYQLETRNDVSSGPWLPITQELLATEKRMTAEAIWTPGAGFYRLVRLR